jgi:hypothetical protein
VVSHRRKQNEIFVGRNSLFEALHRWHTNESGTAWKTQLNARFRDRPSMRAPCHQQARSTCRGQEGPNRSTDRASAKHYDATRPIHAP